VDTDMKKEKELPKWFVGEVYENGDIVSNRFTGEKAELSAKELSMYDLIMGTTMVIEMSGGFMNPKTSSLQSEMAKGLSWMRSSNPSAYMVLLD